MEVKILSNDPELIQALDGYKQTHPRTEEEKGSLQIGEPTRIPGAVESWFEIVALLGVPTVPLAVASGVLANWISSGFKRKSSTTSIHITFRNGSKKVEIEIKAADIPTLQSLVQNAIQQCQ